jgi:hypothetical protein
VGRLVFTITLVSTAIVSAQSRDVAVSLQVALTRAGERVEQFFARAQSIVCLEVVRMQTLDPGYAAQGPSRMVESELRLSWEPNADGGPAAEAQTLRQLLKVNGNKPRANDWQNCTAPEQQTKEPQPLSILLPSIRTDYDFWIAGQEKVDGRQAVMLDYKFRKKATIDVDMVEGRDDCIGFTLDGGMRGRLWIDVETFDVLRLDQRLVGMVEVPLPRTVARLPNSDMHWTLERWDTSIRFKSVSFTNPEERLVLPVSSTALRVTRGSGQPRLRTNIDYVNYRRFLTGGRVVG